MIGIILVSGQSKRMGGNKLLLRYKGKPIVEWVIEKVKKSNLENVVLVYKDNKVKEIGDRLEVLTIQNNNYEEGQSEGIKLAINSFDDEDSYMFIVGDIPRITVQTINNIIDVFRNKGNIVACSSNGVSKNPVIYSKFFKNDLLDLKGDRGGREIIKNNLDKVSYYDVGDSNELEDIDTLEDYIELLMEDN